jgi:hypothetical protein
LRAQSISQTAEQGHLQKRKSQAGMIRFSAITTPKVKKASPASSSRFGRHPTNYASITPAIKNQPSLVVKTDINGLKKINGRRSRRYKS